MKNPTLIIKLALLAAACGLLANPLAHACSRVLWNNNGRFVVTARTMDWSHSFEDMLFVYPRGQKMDGGVDGGIKWTSKYGSVGCSVIGYAKQYGFDFVKDGHTDGINEKGLAAHLLYLEETKYTVMTNDPSYPFHVENIKRYKDFGGDEDLPGTTEPDDRFVRIAHFLGRLTAPENEADALAKILSVIRTATVPFDADEYGPTWWTSLTDCTNKAWYFDWSQNPNTIWVGLKNLNFDEDQPV